MDLWRGPRLPTSAASELRREHRRTWIVRIALAIGHWREGGPMMLVSGIAALLLGAAAVLMWPFSGLWLLGTLLGVDLILHGAGWIGLSMAARRMPYA